MTEKRILACFAAACMGLSLTFGIVTAAHETASAASQNLVGAPTVVTRLESMEQWDAFASEAPASLIITADGDGNAVGSGGTLGTFAEMYERAAEQGIIPIACLPDRAAADAFLTVWKNEIEDTDMAVMSADAQLLADVRGELKELRGVYDCTQTAFTDEGSLYEAVSASTLSMANIVVLNEESAAFANVAYLQGRFKTVWVEAEDGAEEFDIQSIVSSGAYGIVCSDPAAVYAAYSRYPQGALARASLNIAHRGLPLSMAENSVAGALAAAQAGASHIEIDVHLSADGEVIVMHDETIDRTTTGTGAIASMTLAEIRQYEINKTYSGQAVDPQPIPTLGDIFAAFAEDNTVVVCEIKTDDRDVLRAMEPVIEEYDFWDRLVFISFDMDMLAAAHEQLPQVPSASLDSFPSLLFSERAPLYNSINTVADVSLGDIGNTAYYDVMMKDRGYMSFVWTYETASNCVFAMSRGLYGLTNNDAAAFGRNVCALRGQEGQTAAKDGLASGAPIGIVTQTYAGSETEREGTVFSVRDCGTYAEVIASYESGNAVLFSPVFRVDYDGTSAGTPNGNGWIVWVCVGGGILVAGGAAAAVILARKKRAK